MALSDTKRVPKSPSPPTVPIPKEGRLIYDKFNASAGNLGPEREIDRANAMPLIDRTKKPVLPTAPPSMNSTEFPVSIDSEPVPFNSRTCRPEAIVPHKFDRIRPTVPTLGGARMDTSSPPGP